MASSFLILQLLLAVAAATCICPPSSADLINAICSPATSLVIRARVINSSRRRVCTAPPCITPDSLTVIQSYNTQVMDVFSGRSRVGRTVLVRTAASRGECGVRLMPRTVYLLVLQAPIEDDQVMKKLWIIPTCAPPMAWSEISNENRKNLRRIANGFRDEVCLPTVSMETSLEDQGSWSEDWFHAPDYIHYI